MTSSNTSQFPRVAILLCSWQGERFIKEQIDSIFNQDYPNWELWVSDDGSADNTLAILAGYQNRAGKEHLHIVSGPKQGCTANFMSLLCRDEIDADYYGFSDQDDVWEADKISRAVSQLQKTQTTVPAVYGTRTELVDGQNRHIGFSPFFGKPPSFANALVQSIAGGNTMLMNRAARDLLKATSSEDIKTMGWHDWWTYIVVAGVGGAVLYDTYPSLRYRQHGNNLTGANEGWLARFHRIKLLFKGNYREWNTKHVHALQAIRNQLTPQNQKILDIFSIARDNWLIPRLYGLWKAGIYRQTTLGNIGLIVAAFLRKI